MTVKRQKYKINQNYNEHLRNQHGDEKYDPKNTKWGGEGMGSENVKLLEYV